MAKKKKFTLHSALPIQELHAVLTSERYLLTNEGIENPGSSRVVDADQSVRDDGTVTARVHMASQVKAAGAAEQPEAEAAGGDEVGVENNEQPAASEPKEMHVEQTTTVSPIEEDRKGLNFRFATIMPLPGRMGTVFTDMDVRPDDAGTGSDVAVEMRVDTSIPIIGPKLAKHLLGNSEESVGKGLRRAERLVTFPTDETGPNQP